MLTVDLESLEKNAAAAIEFLTSRLNDRFKVKGSRLEFKSTKARTAKLLLHKFLRKEGLKNYRVVVIHSGLVEVLKPEVKKKHVREKLPNYAVPCTISQYQAAAALGGSVPRPRERKWRP